MPNGARMAAVAQHTFAFDSVPDVIESHTRLNKLSDLLGVQQLQSIHCTNTKCNWP